MFDLIIKNGKLVNEGKIFESDIGIKNKRIEKIDAAWKAGCKRFDVAMQGYGGCPFAEDELVGNIATESLIAYCQTEGIDTGLNQDVLAEAGNLVPQIFLNHA